MRAIIVLAYATVLLAGCHPYQQVAEPSAISLSRALRDTVDAMADAYERSVERGTNFGLYACTLTATFAISATQTVENKLGVAATAGLPTTVAPVSISPSGSTVDTTAGNRANTVTLLLATPACMPARKPEEGAAVPVGARPGAVIRRGPNAPRPEPGPVIQTVPGQRM